MPPPPFFGQNVQLSSTFCPKNVLVRRGGPFGRLARS